MNDARRSGIYYGWFIVAASFFVIMMTMGARNGVGVFVLPMSEEFNWSRSSISFAAALGILLNGVSQPILGNLYDRIGGRKLIIYGATVIGITAFLLAFTFHIAYFIFVFGIVMAVAMSAGSITTGAVIVSKWFQRKRATAIGITAAGASVGGLILVPFTTYLIQLLDWRYSWAILGTMIIVMVLPVAYFVLRNKPEDMGLLPTATRRPRAPAGRGRAPRARSRWTSGGTPSVPGPCGSCAPRIPSAASPPSSWPSTSSRTPSKAASPRPPPRRLSASSAL